MKYLFLIFIILKFSLLGCKPKQEIEQGIYYIIKHPNLKSKSVLVLDNGDTTYISTPPLPPPAYYGNYNFILLGTDQVFFHNRIGPWNWCGTGVDEERPEKLNLVPDNFQQIQPTDLDKFLNDSIKSDTLKNGRKTFVKIASPGDTINNPAFQIILDHLKSKRDRKSTRLNFSHSQISYAVFCL